ncbi:glycosyltransferase [Candidatus Coxiella mudrowiae]|uniref:glycosyltransferase n=1 Tax=Candidatus Coxiella mudrowiae TaxID=2054173 RepID=UPI0006624BD8
MVLYSIIVPIFNSDAFLQKLVVLIETAFSKLKISTYEVIIVIIVDDFSLNQSTWQILFELIKNHL